MTTIGMQYDVLPGKEQIFVDAFIRVLEALKGVPGHQESHLYEDVQQKGTYLIVSQFARMEDFTAFIHSDAFKAVTNWGKEEILRGRPRHKVYAQ
ncbi:antibiotic biosynthesis monooxygenase family protein [Humisphaera borealis]|uniref:Antibiotic biosynthesis monooxygenase n=1 Tax=Humisphaera borealis TaxID=2807512 RepID=A0A7M2WXI3_9BACT|nr:antibiotic biosynthesis monooxygenase [Humisphaera borealis]QOV90205.1 antibiotic biosynthesis monooxygenase [Humisphaera borealis]